MQTQLWVGVFSWSFPPWVPLGAVHEPTGSFSTQFTLQRSGEYLVSVFVRAGESYDTIEDTFKVA